MLRSMPRRDGTYSDADIFHSAVNLLRQHGRDAVVIASMQAEQFLADGNVEAYRAWKRLQLMVDGIDDPDSLENPSVH